MGFIRPHIILEGPDGAGKTTLAKALQARGYAYHHEGQPTKPDMLVEYARIFLEKIQQGPTVFDRFATGELVYGHVMRGQDRIFGTKGLELLEMLFNAQGTLQILCLPAYETCKKNWEANHPQEFVKDEGKFYEVYARYSNLQKHFNLIYDYKSLESRRALMDRLVWNRNALGQDFIGDPGSQLVFYGDTPNQELDLPFFATTNSSLFLHDALRGAGYNLKHLLFANCFDPNGKPHDLAAGLAELSHRPRILVALGSKARSALEKVVKVYMQGPGKPPRVNNYEHSLVYMQHPQWVKRFHHSKIHDYSTKFRALRELVPDRSYHELHI